MKNLLKRININELSPEKIQEYIKFYLDRDQIQKSLEIFINEDSIEKFRQLIDYSFINQSDGKENKYVYDLALFLIVSEYASIDEILELRNHEDFQKILEEAVVFELGLYLNSEGGTQYTPSKKFLVQNTPINLFHGIEERLSYSDETNIKEECDRILDDVLVTTNYALMASPDSSNLSPLERRILFVNDLNLAAGKEIVTEKNVYKLFCSINYADPISFSNISIISFLLNFDSEGILDIYRNVLTDEKYIYQFITSREIKRFEKLKNSLYYKTILSGNSNMENVYKRLNTVLIKFLSELNTRTINYKE